MELHSLIIIFLLFFCLYLSSCLERKRQRCYTLRSRQLITPTPFQIDAKILLSGKNFLFKDMNEI